MNTKDIIERARTLIEYVVGYARSAELKPLSSDACVALRDLHAILHAAPPSAPVGVEAELRKLLNDARAAGYMVDTSIGFDTLERAISALAQQPAARTARLDLSVFDQPGDPRSNLIARGWTPPGEQPAAVDGAIRSLPALWRQREPDNGEDYTDYDRGYDQASDECADALEAALAQQPAAVDGAVGTVTRVGSFEVQEHLIELDPEFDERLNNMPAGTVVRLYAAPARDQKGEH